MEYFIYLDDNRTNFVHKFYKIKVKQDYLEQESVKCFKGVIAKESVDLLNRNVRD